MSDLAKKSDAETSSTEMLASCSTTTTASTSDDGSGGECSDGNSSSSHSGCTGGCSDDSDSHCCVCCNCNRGKQKMRKELIRERLRKKLKLRKLRQTATNGDTDADLQRARKLLLQRLQYARQKHKSIHNQHTQFPTSFIIEDSQGRIIVLTKQKIVFLINFHIPVTDICHCGLFIVF